MASARNRICLDKAQPGIKPAGADVAGEHRQLQLPGAMRSRFTRQRRDHIRSDPLIAGRCYHGDIDNAPTLRIDLQQQATDRLRLARDDEGQRGGELRGVAGALRAKLLIEYGVERSGRQLRGGKDVGTCGLEQMPDEWLIRGISRSQHKGVIACDQRHAGASTVTPAPASVQLKLGKIPA